MSKVFFSLIAGNCQYQRRRGKVIDINKDRVINLRENIFPWSVFIAILCIFRKIQELKKELEDVELKVSATLLITVTRSKRSRLLICAVI